MVYPPLEGLAAEGYDVVKKLLDVAQKGKAVSEANFRKSNDLKTSQMEVITVTYYLFFS